LSIGEYRTKKEFILDLIPFHKIGKKISDSYKELK